MYTVTDKYKQLIYQEDMQHLLNVYINGSLVNLEDDLKLGFNISYALFNNDEFSLGTTPAKMIELKLYKKDLPTQLKSFYIETGVSDQIIPIGYFTLESIEEDDDIVTIKAIDNMVKFEFNYDGSKLTYPCTIIKVLRDICLKAGVELRFYFFFKYE